MRAIAVIGAQFGDEGKGLLTDFSCHKMGSRPIVVRYCGGAQAGHTVVTPEGSRHVFHHFGAGTLAGSSTFLSSFFIANPMLWHSEFKSLQDTIQKFGSTLYVHGNCYLTTPYDMLINQYIEKIRNNSKHGSCGVGINETVTRNTSSPYNTIVDDIKNPFSLREKLEIIRRQYVFQRLEKLGFEPDNWFINIANSDRMLENFLEKCDQFATNTIICGNEDIPASDIVFEGSQGLLLDEHHKFFPFVTRARTGLPNILSLCTNFGIRDIEVIYVTRAYMTRHGAGPFPTEDRNLEYTDLTNVPNKFQGTLRFGHLDIDLLTESIKTDLSRKINLDIQISTSIAVTCLDQVEDNVKVSCDGETELHKSILPKVIASKIDAENIYTSFGPTRLSVHKQTEMIVA